MQAKLYGVSVGPGNPELMTLQAVRILSQVPVIAYVKTHRQNSLALDIVEQVVDLSDKTRLELPFLMVKDRQAREVQYQDHVAKITEWLEQGQSVAMINLGDISVYSTFAYIGERVQAAGYACEWLPGVTSFCAGACATQSGLAAMDQPIHLIPGSFDISESLDWPGTKVYMKSASAFGLRKQQIEASGHQAIVVEKASLPEQRIAALADVEDSSYFSLIIVKEPK